MGNKSRFATKNQPAESEATKVRTVHIGSADFEFEPVPTESLAELDARENPTKITHGFWLQQYSWLHAPEQPAPEQSSPKRRSSSRRASQLQAPGAGATGSPTAGRRHRLLVRWSNLMRTFGGSTGDTQQKAASGEQQVGSSCSAPASALRSPARRRLVTPSSPSKSGRWLRPSQASPQEPKTEKKTGSWFLRSLSSSHLLGPLSSHLTPSRGKKASHRNDRDAEGGWCSQGASSSVSSQQQAPVDGTKRSRLMSRLTLSGLGDKSKRNQAGDPSASYQADGSGGPTGSSTGSPHGGFHNQLGSILLASPLFRRRKSPSVAETSKSAANRAPSGRDKSAGHKWARRQIRGELISSSAAAAVAPDNKKQVCDSECLVGAKSIAHQDNSAEPSQLSLQAAPDAAEALGGHSLDVDEEKEEFKLHPERRLGQRRDCYANQADQPRNNEATGRQEPRAPQSGKVSWHDWPNQPAGGDLTQMELSGEREAAMLPLIQPLASPCSSVTSSLLVDLAGAPAGQAQKSPAAALMQNSSSSCSSLVDLADSPASSAQPVDYDQSLTGSSQCSRPSSQPAGQPSLLLKFDFQRTGSHKKVRHQQDMHSSSQEGTQQQQPASKQVSMALKSNLKKLVKRQQSVDSYRMARDLKNKLRRQQEARDQHQSSEAIESAKSVGDEQQPPERRKFSVGVFSPERPDQLPAKGRRQVPPSVQPPPLKICIDPYAKAGSFTLPGEEDAPTACPDKEEAEKNRTGPSPPNTLSLMPLPTSPAGAFIVGSFSGCITPTYPTHHLPSPKYVSPALAKKYSNASTVSSQGGEQSTGAPPTQPAKQAPSQTGVPSDTESSMGGGSSATRSALLAPPVGDSRIPGPPTDEELAAQDEQAAALRRAQLAEHIYDNRCGLGEDMKFLASLPELCDITFLVGETREPVCAVKSVLAARSRIFHKILFGGNRTLRRIQRQQQQDLDQLEQPGAEQALISDGSRRDSSPRASGQQQLSAAGKSPVSPNVSRSTSPNQQLQQTQQWSVTSDASGYNPSPRPDDSATFGGRSGRVSVASGGAGRESMSQASQGSQQPLIIGPGQTATPAKRLKKGQLSSALSGAMPNSAGHHHGSRLSRMFMKRASDPSIKQAYGTSGALNGINQSSYLDKMSSSQMSTTMIIEEFEPDVFRQLIEYIHTGCVLLQARTLLGLLNAADYYGLEQLRKACLRFVSCCITVDTVCSLLSTAERYIQYKCTKSIVQKVLEFVDNHADEIFKLNAFGLLPEHVVRLILARDGLQADEYVKYNGVYTWCEHYCRSYELTNISDVMHNFLDLIQFHKIPTNILLSEIYPTHLVPDNIFLSALAYQADPDNFETQPARARRMTLPNPTFHKDYEDDDDLLRPLARSSVTTTAGEKSRWSPISAPKKRKSSQHSAKDSAFESGVNLEQSSKSFKPYKQESVSRSGKLRKGSIAQVSISNVIKLSHKLSIKKRHSNLSQSKSNSRQQRQQQSPLNSRDSQDRPQDPLQVGQQILNAYLARQRQRELEEQRAKELEEKAAKKANLEQQQQEGTTGDGQAPDEDQQSAGGDKQQQATSDKQPVVKSQSSTRKSFKDFKHISRRIFMRRSSSKTLQQSSSVASQQSDNSLVGASPNRRLLSSAQSNDFAANISGDKENKSMRRVFKIKRSETVFESSSAAGQLSHRMSSNLARQPSKQQ